MRLARLRLARLRLARLRLARLRLACVRLACLRLARGAPLALTGSSLRANKLRIVDELMVSTPRLIANHESWKNKWKRAKIETMALLLKGALEAEAKVGLKMNIEEKHLRRLLDSLPALRRPTISNLSQAGWVAVETIIDEHVVRELIPQLKAAGAEGIIEYPLNKVVY